MFVFRVTTGDKNSERGEAGQLLHFLQQLSLVCANFAHTEIRTCKKSLRVVSMPRIFLYVIAGVITFCIMHFLHIAFYYSFEPSENSG